MNPGISIIICCYNSAKRLPETLRHVAEQQVPPEVPWEVLLIDNASTDATSFLAQSQWDEYGIKGISFKILAQPIRGKVHAIQMGFYEAAYDYILTCDDDNWLNPEYVSRAFSIMQSSPNVAVLGGCGIFEPESPLNPEIEPFKGFYINGPQYWAATEHWVYGAGAVYRKSIFMELLNNNWRLITPGRVGNQLNGGEDAEFCFAAYLCGYEIIADKQLTFRHFVPSKRQNINYIKKLAFWNSYSNVLLNSYFFLMNKDDRGISQMVDSWLLGVLKTLAKKVVLQVFKIFRTMKSSNLDQELDDQKIWGTFNSLIKNRRKIIGHHDQLKITLKKIGYRQEPLTVNK